MPGTRAFSLGVRAGVLLAALLLSGCPYTSDRPLSDPSAARIDPALLGTWRTRDRESGEWHDLTFAAFDEHQLVAVAPGDAGENPAVLRAFVTPVGTELFLNLRELGTGSTDWYLARYQVGAGRLVMTVVDEGLFSGRAFSSSEELLGFLRTHLDDPLLYAAAGEERQDMVWERVPD